MCVCYGSVGRYRNSIQRDGAFPHRIQGRGFFAFSHKYASHPGDTVVEYVLKLGLFKGEGTNDMEEPMDPHGE